MWLVLLLVINYVMARTIHYDAVLNYGCLTNENCSDLVPNSMCLNRKCICQLGYKSDGLSRCIYESRYRRQINFGVRMLGEDCESNDECRRTPVDGTKVCLVNQCQCSSGHVPIDAYRCIRNFEQFSSNTRVTKPSSEIEPPGYGSICSTNPDCQHSTVQLECLRGSCVCLEGYVPLGKYLCYNIRGQDAPIIESSTTTSTSFSTTITTFNPPKNEMIKSLGNTCTNDYYCRRTVSQSHCFNGKCICMNGYISLDGYTCSEDLNRDETTTTTTISANHKSLLGGKCSTNQNCQTSDGQCVNNICICPNGYFPIDDWNCLQDPDSSHETSTQTTTTTTILTTTVFRWWPWSPSSTTSQSLIDSKNTFRFRCLLNRQCASIDVNSHCTLFGRCVCNINYNLEITNTEQRCIRQIINEDDCD